jgi:CzcA family heavy metal efflux pump
MEITYAVEDVLDEMKPQLDTQGITIYPRLHRPATFIETALLHMNRSLFLGAILVVAVLFLFLFNFRTAFVTITAIPLSLLTAVIVLQWFGITLNTITLGGLAIAIGEVVDDAIIDVENIFRRLKENRAAGRPRAVFDVVLDASIEVRSAVVYATFVVVLVFVPVLTMSGLQGRMFAPLGLAYVLAILASLLVALTVTPALSLAMLPKAADRQSRDPLIIRGLKWVYQRIMAAVILNPRPVVGASLALVLVTVGMLGSFGGEFLPEFREGHFVVQVNAIPGTSLPEMMRMGRLMTEDLFKNVTVNGEPVIDTIEQQAGRAELGEDPWGPHRSELHIELKPDIPGADQADVQKQIRQTMERYPGITSEVLTFLGDRISETITGETAAVVVNLYGDDLDMLDLKAQEVARVITGVPGAVDVRVASPPGAPQVVAQLRPDRLKLFGFQPIDVLDAIQTAYQGTTVAECYEGNRVYEVVVVLDESARRDPEALGSLLVRNAAGTTVQLEKVAEIFPRTGRYMVLHDGARRRQAVTCNVQGRDLAAFVAEAKQKVAQIRFPQGVYPLFAGEAEQRIAARNEILVHSSLAGLGIVLLLATVFQRWQNLMLVLANLPFAFVGGVLAVHFTGASMSIGSIVGFVTLFGITMRNSVMMISHFEHLVHHEDMTWGINAAIRGASERVVPVVMTALVTGLGLLPIALGTGEVGREIEGPMAVVILGGLVTSTLLNLLVLPTLALQFGRFEARPTHESA